MTEAMVCHFDGPQPYATDFSGDPTGHLGQAATVSGGAVYRPGRYGKGLQSAPPTTNYINNPVFENNVADGWTAIGTVARDTARASIGSASCKITAGSGINAQMNSNTVSLTNGQSLAVSLQLYRMASVSHDVLLYDATNAQIRATGTITAVGAWDDVRLVWTNSTGGTVNVDVRIRNKAQDGASKLWIDAVQAEKLAYVTPFCHGGMGDGHSWAGTAHNSASSRTAATVTYTSPLGATTGGLFFWFNAMQPSSSHVYLVSDTGRRLELSVRYDTGALQLYVNGVYSLLAGTAVTWDTWHHIGLTYDGDETRVYLDGSLYATTSSITEPGAVLAIGRLVAGGAFYANGYFDELIITDHCPSAAAVRSYYADGVMRVVGENESINLLDPDGLYLSQGGWRPQIAAPDGLGDYEDVAEQLRLEWMNETDDERGPAVQRLGRLVLEARRKDPRRDPNSFTPVYFEVRGHHESEMRYAVLREGRAAELPERVWGPAGAVDVTLALTREGAWRAVAPRWHALPWPVVDGATVYNKQDSDGDNYVTIAAGDVPGDAEALTVIYTEHSILIGRQIIAKRTGLTADLDMFQSHFNVIDQSSSWTLTTDTNAPDDKAMIYAPGGTAGRGVTWAIPLANAGAYQIPFNIYVGIEETGTVSSKSVFSLNFAEDYGPDVEIEKQSALIGSPSSPVMFMPGGEALVADNAYVSGLTYGGYGIELAIRLSIEVTDAASSVTLYNVFLVPLAEGVFSWDVAFELRASRYLHMDGRWEQAFVLDAGGNVNYRLRTYGQYLTITPGIENRLYFYSAEIHEGQYHYKPNDAAAVTVWAVPRYLALRGAF